MEIAMSTKRKLLIVHGTLGRPIDDQIKGEQWDACNNLVIDWIMNFIFESAAESILYIESAIAIWKQLQKRFSISNGLRKYKLNRDIYNLKQNRAPDCATRRLKGLGEHRDGLCHLVNSPLKQISSKLLSISNKVMNQLFDPKASSTFCEKEYKT
ncbi:hypothetical protein Cgig2_010923 [Carnegiea gigantea]|uniref:Uncharacterized protein n=1 Tax=Carnegiea gigantea TaxID=171969 RepID=A0A9Q1K331_9CARY|nr:hypothetical protein Cgig2_010923 [Carnegiea gigantea]